MITQDDPRLIAARHDLPPTAPFKEPRGIAPGAAVFLAGMAVGIFAGGVFVGLML